MYIYIYITIGVPPRGITKIHGGLVLHSKLDTTFHGEKKGLKEKPETLEEEKNMILKDHIQWHTHERGSKDMAHS